MTTAIPDSSAGVTPSEEIARMTTTTASTNPFPDISSPAGGFPGEWGNEEPWRIIYGQRHEIGAYVVGVWACQQSNGSMHDNNGHDVYIDEIDEHGDQCERLNLSSAAARQLSQALPAAADEIDGWLAR